MKKLTLALLFFALACGSSQPGGSSSTSAPGHGALSIEVIPNPIVAIQVSGNTYDFPFEVVIRETGGHAVNVERVSARVLLGGGLELGSETWDAARIRSMGYNTALRANSETRFKFTQRKEVPDDRLFGGVSAELRVDAVDDTGAATTGRTTVTVRRQ